MKSYSNTHPGIKLITMLRKRMLILTITSLCQLPTVSKCLLFLLCSCSIVSFLLALRHCKPRIIISFTCTANFYQLLQIELPAGVIVSSTYQGSHVSSSSISFTVEWVIRFYVTKFLRLRGARSQTSVRALGTLYILAHNWLKVGLPSISHANTDFLQVNSIGMLVLCKLQQVKSYTHLSGTKSHAFSLKFRSYLTCRLHHFPLNCTCCKTYGPDIDVGGCCRLSINSRIDCRVE